MLIQLVTAHLTNSDLKNYIVYIIMIKNNTFKNIIGFISGIILAGSYYIYINKSNDNEYNITSRGYDVLKPEAIERQNNSIGIMKLVCNENDILYHCVDIYDYKNKKINRKKIYTNGNIENEILSIN